MKYEGKKLTQDNKDIKKRVVRYVVIIAIALLVVIALAYWSAYSIPDQQ